jgi:hypothetical protein
MGLCFDWERIEKERKIRHVSLKACDIYPSMKPTFIGEDEDQGRGSAPWMSTRGLWKKPLWGFVS